MNQLALKVLKKRQAIKAPKFLDGAYKVQDDFIAHPAKFKAMLATRRTGKSYGCGKYLCKEAYENPGVSVLYIALTRESAKKIMFKDVLKPINRKYKLNIKFNETALTATLPNGSVIYLIGVDSSEDEKDKILGQKYKLAIIDESASFSIDLRQLVYGTLKPAMADLGGTIVMVGTPGNLTKSLFFDVTTGKEPGWHLLKANTADNPFMADKWKKEIEELTINQPYIVDTPMFKQMYLGQWVVDIEALVYKYNEDRNLIKERPVHLSGSWQYLMGVDLGYDDDSAFVVVAFHEHDTNLYVVDSYNRSKMDITDVANKIKDMKQKWDIHKIVVDGANKQAVEEIKKRHSISLETADKRGKEDFIEIMNSELIMGRIKLVENASAPIINEWSSLVWKEKGGKIVVPKEENPNCSNHLSDALLYIWRYCFQYLSQPAKLKPKYQTPQWFEQEVSDMEQAAIEFFEKQAENEDYYQT